jgi:hypothetical protein
MQNNSNSEIEIVDANNIRNLAITKQLNFLIGSGASMPAIPLMSQIDEDDINEKNNILVSKIKDVSKILLEKPNEYEGEIKRTYKNYCDFIFQVIQLLNKSNSRQVPRSVNIFTTNYDLFIEIAVDDLMAQNRIVFNDGTSGYFKKYIDSSNYNRVVSYKGLNDNYIDEIPSINLIKPHGSVNWKKTDEDKILVCSDIQEEPVVVKPTGNEGEETFLNNYFHDMLRMFQLELDKPQSILFVLGFSFQDKHIAKMFMRALQNIELLVFVFAYRDDDITTIKNNLGFEEKLPHNLKILSPKNFCANSKINIENTNEKNEIDYTFNIESLTKIFEGIKFEGNKDE